MEFPFRIGHSRIRALLSPYVDGEVSAAETRRVEEHAAACPACRDELDSLTATVELVRALPELELPRSFELTRLPEEEPRVSFGVWAPRLAMSVAGLLLVVLLAGDFTGTLVQYGGSDEATSETQADASGAMDVEASAPAAPQAAAAPPQAAQLKMPDAAAETPTSVAAAQAAPAAAAQSRSSEEEAATPEPPSAPAAAAKAGPAGKAAPESATPAPADVSPEAMKARVPADDQPSPEPETALQAAAAQQQAEAPAEAATTPAPVPTWDDSVGDDADGEIGVPLRELQIAAAVCFLALAAATVWHARRRRRRV